MCSDAELVQNPEDLVTLRRLRVPEERLHLLGTGIDLRRFDPDRWPGARERLRGEWGIQDEEVAIGFVGRFVAEKGVPELLEAVARLRAKQYAATLVLIGEEDPEKPDAVSGLVLDFARKAGAHVVGWNDPIEPCYLALDILALPSHREGFPRAPMEAAALGIPVVTTDIRGCRETVVDGTTGLLVPVRNVAALEAALEQLIANTAIRDQYGLNARAWAKNRFDVRRQVEITLRVYRATEQ
jgi:glycosyltransferase involved in cell wall biosynthesis